VLRQKNENIAAPIIWKPAHANLPALQKACRDELDAGEGRAHR
jgi:hypothetical protein